jgi:hypothetical protein
MRITEQRLRQLIREELVSSGLISEKTSDGDQTIYPGDEGVPVQAGDSYAMSQIVEDDDSATKQAVEDEIVATTAEKNKAAKTGIDQNQSSDTLRALQGKLDQLTNT